MDRRPAIRFRSILCPVDFSAHSRTALQHAAAAAHRFGGRITVLFVNDALLAAAASRSAAGRLRFAERARIELGRFAARSIAAGGPPTSEVALAVATGNPADEILAAARRLRSDLIVIGTQGLSGFQKLFFGSTTEQVLRRARIPVLAVPAAKRIRRGATAPLQIQRVLAPIDLAGEWQPDAARAANLAAAFGAELVLVHVVAHVQAPPWLRQPPGATDRRRLTAASRALDRVRTKLAPDLATMTRVLVGNPADEIARLTTGSPALVVMSLRGGAGVWGARRGSIAYHVLTHASTPVLALPRQRLGGHLSTRLSRAISTALTRRDRIELAGIDALLSMASSRKRRSG
jgi:nucleotide-binding universal stress UspA family protein